MGANKKLYGWYPTGSAWVPVKVDADGKVVISSAPTRARAYLSANQLNLVNGVWTKVLLNSESYDVGGNFANYKFTVPIAGYYLIVSSIGLISVVATKLYYMALYKNGVRIALTAFHSSLAAFISLFFNDIIYFVVGDYIELYVESNAGVNTVDVEGDESETYLAVNLLQV